MNLYCKDNLKDITVGLLL